MTHVIICFVLTLQGSCAPISSHFQSPLRGWEMKIWNWSWTKYTTPLRNKSLFSRRSNWINMSTGGGGWHMWIPTGLFYMFEYSTWMMKVWLLTIWNPKGWMETVDVKNVIKTYHSLKHKKLLDHTSLILLWWLDPWPLDPLGCPKCFKDFFFKQRKRKKKIKAK